MRRHNYIPPIIPFVMLLLMGCAREVMIDLPETPPRIVAISHFEPGQSFKVRVTISQSLNATGDPEAPTDADVSLSSNGLFLDKLRARYINDKLYWVSKLIAKPNVPYTLTVRVPGRPTVEAKSIVPTHRPLQPIKVSQEEITYDTLTDGTLARRMALELRVKDLPSENRYFAFNIQHVTDVLNVEGPEPFVEYSYTANSLFVADGRTSSLLYNISEPVVLIDAEFWNTSDQVLRLDALIPYKPETEAPQRVLIEWRTLSEEFYKYHLSLARQGNNLPLSDPDAVFNNVVDGYGNFSGYTMSLDTVVELR
ncbi:MAG: DUF4249 family protein [Saprospiraceae bacterium]